MKTGGSVCVWKTSHVIDDNDIDPNYLLASNQAQSPFHQALHAFSLRFPPEVPLLHVDIHGKMDRKHNCEIEVGLEPLRQLWPE